MNCFMIRKEFMVLMLLYIPIFRQKITAGGIWSIGNRLKLNVDTMGFLLLLLGKSKAANRLVRDIDVNGTPEKSYSDKN